MSHLFHYVHSDNNSEATDATLNEKSGLSAALPLVGLLGADQE
jgi:hypothetical protein